MTPCSPSVRVSVMVGEVVTDRVAEVTDLVGDFEGVAPPGNTVVDGLEVVVPTPSLFFVGGINVAGPDKTGVSNVANGV